MLVNEISWEHETCTETKNPLYSAIRFPFSILLQEDVPKNWYQLREGHYAHVIAMGVWLVVATIISLAYTSQLLASLTAKGLNSIGY